MPTKRLPKANWTPKEKRYQMPAAVEAKLMALGAKHNNTGNPQLSEEENFTPDNREILKAAFIEAVSTYWFADDFKKGPTAGSVRRNIKEIRTLIDELIKKLDRLDAKTAEGLRKFGAAEVAFDASKKLSLEDRIRLAHESLWTTRSAARKYLNEEPMDRDEAGHFYWTSALSWRCNDPPRVGALLLLYDGIARALGERQRLGVSGDSLTGSLVGFLDLFMHEARIKHVQRRTVADDFLLARNIWIDEYRKGPL